MYPGDGWRFAINELMINRIDRMIDEDLRGTDETSGDNVGDDGDALGPGNHSEADTESDGGASTGDGVDDADAADHSDRESSAQLPLFTDFDFLCQDFNDGVYDDADDNSSAFEERDPFACVPEHNAPDLSHSHAYRSGATSVTDYSDSATPTVGMCFVHVLRAVRKQADLLPRGRSDLQVALYDIDRLARTRPKYFDRAWQALRTEWRSRKWSRFAKYFNETWIATRSGWALGTMPPGAPQANNGLEGTWPTVNEMIPGQVSPITALDKMANRSDSVLRQDGQASLGQRSTTHAG